ALAEGVREHIATVRRRLGGASVVVQIDEPALPAVLAAAIPTASGFSRHRSVSPADATQAIDWLVTAIHDSDATSVVHCCAPDVPFGLLRETSVQAVSFDLSLLGRNQYDDLAAWVDAGRELWPGVIPAVEVDGQPPNEADLTRRLLTWWSTLGYSDPETLPSVTVTPTCGLAAASPDWARQALSLAERVARNLTSEGS
nr:methionine synthase [Propionibacteriales bacterium]